MDTHELPVSEGRLACRVWRAARDGDVLVQLHGIESHSGWFTSIAERLRAAGLTTYAFDRLGSGCSEGPRGDVPAAATWLDHVRAVLDWVRRRHAGRLVLVGSCWGGKLGLRFALDHPEALDGLVLLAPGLCLRVGPSPWEKLHIAWAAARHPVRRFPIPIPRDELFTGDPAALAAIGRDPYRLRRVTARFLWETHRLDDANTRDVGTLRVPFLACFGAEDAIVDVPAAVTLLRRAHADSFALHVIPGARHSLEFEAPDRAAAVIAEWYARLGEAVRPPTGGARRSA